MCTQRLLCALQGVVLLMMLVTFSSAQSPVNLLQNAMADQGLQHWRAAGEAGVVQSRDKGLTFVVRNQGHFFQDVSLPTDAQGKFVLMIGVVSSERVNADGAITGLPYLSGYLLENARSSGKILAHLQGQNLLGSNRQSHDWVIAWGIFPVVEGTTAMRFFLNQAERQGAPQNGSVARFDDLGLYVFESEQAAKAFVKMYQAVER